MAPTVGSCRKHPLCGRAAVAPTLFEALAALACGGFDPPPKDFPRPPRFPFTGSSKGARGHKRAINTTDYLGTHFEGGLEWFWNGLIRKLFLGPILGDHRIYLAHRGSSSTSLSLRLQMAVSKIAFFVFVVGVLAIRALLFWVLH